MRKSIHDRAKEHMTSAAAAHLSTICLLGDSLRSEVSRLLDVIDEKDAVITQRNGEIKNLQSGVTHLREINTDRNAKIWSQQTEIAALREEVQSLTQDLTSRSSDDKLQADINSALAGKVNFIHDVFITTSVHDETQFSPIPKDFFVRNDAGDIIGISAKHVLLDTAPGGAQLSEADVLLAELSAALDKRVTENVRKELIKARQPGGMLGKIHVKRF